MARKLTKEEIANGIFIDGSQLEKISDDVAETYNTLELNSINKKYQVSQMCFTDGFTSAAFPQLKYNVWQPSLNTPQGFAPPYPAVAGQGVKNELRLKGYFDPGTTAGPLQDGDKWLFWQNGVFFNKPVIILNWSLYLQGSDLWYEFDGQNESGATVTSGIICNIQTKNSYEQRDRRFDEILLNNNVSLLREKFYGSSIYEPEGYVTSNTFPPPPEAPRGFFIENHLNIPLPEGTQVNFTVSFPNDRVGAPPFNMNWVSLTKFCSTVTFLEEIE